MKLSLPHTQVKLNDVSVGVNGKGVKEYVVCHYLFKEKKS